MENAKFTSFISITCKVSTPRQTDVADLAAKHDSFNNTSSNRLDYEFVPR